MYADVFLDAIIVFFKYDDTKSNSLGQLCPIEVLKKPHNLKDVIQKIETNTGSTYVIGIFIML